MIMKKLLLPLFLFISSFNLTAEQNALSDYEFSLSYSMSFSDVDSLENAMSFVGRLSYNDFIKQSDKPGEINTIKKLVNRYNRSEDSEQFDSLSIQNKANELSQFVDDQYGMKVPSSVLISELAIKEVLDKPNNWRNTLSNIKGDLNFDEKIRLASYLGGRFSDDYNSDRAAEGASAEGIVSVETMLRNLGNNRPGGICRDVTQAQSHILQELGVDKKNIYQMSYATTSGHHGVLIIQDPNNPKKVIKINYDLVQVNEGITGSTSLSQHGLMADAGIAFKIYDAEGSPVINLPTEMGRVLRDVTNHSSDINQGVDPYSISKTVIKTRWVDLSIFTADLSNGDTINGLAINKIQDLSNLSRELGLAVIERKGNDRERTIIDQQALYARFKEVRERNKEIGPLYIRAYAGVEFEASLLMTKMEDTIRDKTKEDQNFDAFGSLFTGAELFFSTDAATYMAGLEATGQLDFRNMGEANSGGYELHINEIQFKFGAETNITQNTKANATAILTFKTYGEIATMSLGIENTRNKTALDLIYQTPLSEIPLFFEGATETLEVTASKEIELKKTDNAKGRVYLGAISDLTLDQNNSQIGIELSF